MFACYAVLPGFTPEAGPSFQDNEKPELEEEIHLKNDLHLASHWGASEQGSPFTL